MGEKKILAKIHPLEKDKDQKIWGNDPLITPSKIVDLDKPGPTDYLDIPAFLRKGTDNENSSGKP